MARTYRTLALPALAAATAILTACGSGSSQDVQATLKQGFSTPIESANVNLDAQVRLNGIKQLKGPIKLTLQGPYESGQGKTIPKADWDIAASAGGQNFTAGFVSTGDNAYITFQGQSYEIGKQTIAQINTQIAAAAKNKQKKGGLAQFGIHPSDWLTDAKDEGTDKVGGVETDHVSAAVDVGKFLDDLNTLIAKAGSTVTGSAAPPKLSDQEKQQIQKVVKNPRFDVYVGKDDHVIRRLSADISFNIPAAQQAQLGGLRSGTISFSIEFANVGQPQTITAPANAKPITDLTAKLGGLASALGGAAGGASGGGSSSGAGATSEALQKYSQCLQKADPSKPAELQKCADLLK